MGFFGQDGLLLGNARYKKIRDLNHGAFGFVVYCEVLQTNERVALKFIKRGPELQNINKYVEREIVNHMQLRHPHVIKLYEVFLTTTHLVLAMEYAAGGDLFHYVTQRLGAVSEQDARWFFQQLILGVDYCHRMGVSSRDIKLENALLDGSPRPLIKLADFGFSKDANAHSAPTSRVGTPAYLAPEVVSNQPGHAYDGQKADIWSCGVLLFVMSTGDYPFNRQGDDLLEPHQRLNTMLQRILRAEYSFSEKATLSEEGRDLIGRMLALDPAERATLQEIQQHPWFQQGLNPAALGFNEKLVRDGLANQPPAALLDQVRAVVNEAANEGQPADAAARQPGDWGSTGAEALDDMVRNAAAEADDSWEWTGSG